MILTPNQIAALVYFTGGWGPGPTGVTIVNGQQKRPPKNDPQRIAYEKFLDVAIAVCLSESGGDTLAKNASSSASGLWQIMASVHKERIEQQAHYVFVEYDQPAGKTTMPNVFDPRVNSLVAKEVWNAAGKKWTPWEAYNTGSYRKNLGHGKAAYKFITNKENLTKERDAFIANIMETENYADLAGSVAGAATGQGLMNAAGWKDMLSNALNFMKDAGITIGIFLLGAILLLLGAWTMLSKTSAGRAVKTVGKGPVGLAKSVVK